MSYENYSIIFNERKEGKTIRPKGKGLTFNFDYEPKKDKNYRLFITGETATFFQLKCEDPTIYHEITDSLNSEHAVHDRFCLDFSAKESFKYIKAAYRKLMWPPRLRNFLPIEYTEIEYGISVKGKNVKVLDGGFLRMRIDVRYKKDGVSDYDVLLDADETLILDFPQGTYDYKHLREKFDYENKDIASLGIWIEGTNYEGEIYVERPILQCGEYNTIPDFAPPLTNKDWLNWTGQHLSRKEWPEFKVTLNKKVIHEGEIFERCHERSDWSINVPEKLLKKKNTLTFELLSDYHDALPYRVHECGIIESPDGEVVLVAVSPAGIKGKNAHILVRTKDKNTKVKLNFSDKNLSGKTEYIFKESGLHGIALKCNDICKNAKFVIESGKTKIESEIPVILEREDDGVILGSGDAVYISQDMKETEDFLCWYFSENVGDFITFRPVYRWGGERVLNPETWKMVNRVLNELEVKYTVLVDGRELPGQAVNPTCDMLEGEGFLGRQMHERDGHAFYWGAGTGEQTPTARQIHDMITEIRKAHPDKIRCSKYDAVYDGAKLYTAVDPNAPRDMKKAKEHSVARLNGFIYDQIRHSGPSVMFKYLYEAGFKCLEAETMDGGMEMLLAYLRGLAKAVGMDAFGVHHAMQWMCYPHDEEKRYKLFRLALYISYMLGTHEINVEEGFWRIEEHYSHHHRFDVCCRKYLEEHQRFYDYKLTHSRKGKLHTPVGLIQGRYDGRIGFGINAPAWGCLENTDAEKSWKDILKLYYPLNKEFVMDHYGSKDKPVGYQTGTPYGQADVLPIEYSKDIYGDYKLLSFAGYNCAEKEDLDALKKYVEKGGKLLLSFAHLTKTTNLDDILAGKLEYDNNSFDLTDGVPTFAESTVNGVKVEVCTNINVPFEVISKTDDDKPLLVSIKSGEGTIYLYNVSAYPAHESIKDKYVETLKALTCEAVVSEDVWVECGEDVEFAVYDAGREKQIFIMAVDWYNSEETLRHATLRVGGNAYSIDIPWGEMLKCVTDGNKVVWCTDESGEILSVGEKIYVQGKKDAEFIIAKDGKTRRVKALFADSPLLCIE